MSLSSVRRRRIASLRWCTWKRLDICWHELVHLVDLFEKQGILVKDGNRLKYTDPNGVEHKEYRKNWDGAMLDLVMKDTDGNKLVEQIEEKLVNTPKQEEEI